MVVGLCGNEIRMNLGLRGDVSIQMFQAIEERRRVGHGQHAGVAFRHDDAVLMNGIGRIRRNHRVARPDHREQQMRQRVLGADGDDGFAFGIEIHAVVGAIAAHDLLAQREMPRDAE